VRLRQILRKYGAWARIQPDVVMLRERQDCGHALTAQEERVLLHECGQSRSRLLLPFVVLALETGARFNTVRTLQWRNINFSDRCLKFGKDKTAAGSGRTVPVNARLLETLKFWAQSFPDRRPEHYVLPQETCSQSGAEDSFGFGGEVIYETNPTKPVGGIKTAWQAAKRRTQRHCPHCDGRLDDRLKPDTGYVCSA
jgi:integrase